MIFLIDLKGYLSEIAARVTLFIDKDTRQYIEPPGVGIAWLWKLPDTHPFYRAALYHDSEYDLMREGKSPYESSAIPDLAFYRKCIRAAAEQEDILKIEYYLAQAKTFYILIRMWGRIRWKNNG